ncbi:MAG: hypothetical protein QW666_01260 [Candidatus Woesearchaeota archaeon]
MNTLAKIVTYTLVVGSLLIGLPSCKKKSKEEDPRYIQRVAALEQMVNIYEQAKPEFNDAEKKEAMVNCLTDVKNMLELFVTNHIASEKEYSQFVEIAGSYAKNFTVGVMNTRNPDLGALRRAKGFIDSTNEYITQFGCHKKPFEQIENIRKIIPPNEKSGSMQKLCIEASSKCYELFDTIEAITRNDMTYLEKVINYTEKNNDKESELICKLAKIHKEKKETVKTKAEYYKKTFQQHSEILKKYFPDNKESQNF